ncbi:PEP-CTERM sorting domain-containing protein [Sulfuriroseicoccus oceanibius]|uniref:PEP-CTERM sorting domain-containing protein n=1 Tax=Sulfuriroseicoccus oceanibius TaxID=2707525 RepID=A0A6B3L889_9BACT|nr:PEP-CTERM sorting domain-containing protein [Sulfuriroseicoccus oceanibius]QQL44943.1 PEP-CTERM sorting domain-containing protein [Sulfuriroseicoccus oceanibius]
MKWKSLVVAMVATSAGADAAITAIADSSTFDYKYEMDVDPTTQNLDGLGAEDWFNGTSGGFTSPAVSGGFAFSNQATSATLLRGDFNAGGAGSMWRELVSGGAASTWTMEVRFAKVSGTQGSNGWFGIATANLSESNSSAVYVLDDRIRLNGGADYLVGTDFSTGFHTVRVAHDAVDNAYYYWVNDVLLNTDLSTPIAGTNGGSFDNNTFIGDFSGSLSGEWQIDYVRVDTEALAAVPEPSAAVLLGLGGLAMILRRRS